MLRLLRSQRKRSGAGHNAGVRLFLVSQLRQPKIQNLCVLALGHKDIRRLDIAVNDPLGVRGIQCISDLNRQL